MTKYYIGFDTIAILRTNQMVLVFRNVYKTDYSAYITALMLHTNLNTNVNKQIHFSRQPALEKGHLRQSAIKQNSRQIAATQGSKECRQTNPLAIGMILTA